MSRQEEIKELANDIRTKIYGAEVRETLARAVEMVASDTITTEGFVSILEDMKDSGELAQIINDQVFDMKVDKSELEVIVNIINEKANMTDLEKNQKNVNEKLEFQANSDTPLLIPTYEKSQQLTHPKVLHFANKWNGYHFWMAMTPFAHSNDLVENPSIVVSNDGVNWKVPDGLTNPIDIPTSEQLAVMEHMSDADLLMRGDTMELWYRFTHKDGGQGGNIQDRIYRKTSTDGVNWSESQEVINVTKTHGYLLSPSTLWEDNKYKMWYVNNGKLWYIESADAVSWSNRIEIPVNHLDAERTYEPWHIEVVKIDGKYALVSNSRITGGAYEFFRLFYGTSIDGSSFEVKQILKPRSSMIGTWDNNSIYKSSLIKAWDRYYLYYSAQSTTNFWGVALSQGLDMHNLSGVNLLGSTNDLTNVNNIVLDGEHGSKLYMDKHKASNLSHTELKMVDYGVDGIRLKYNSERKRFEIRDDSGSLFSDLALRDLIVGLNRFYNEWGKYVDVRASATKGNTLEITKNAVGDGGKIDLSGIYLDGEEVEAVEGAIRYNKDKKRHEGFNGEFWMTMYSPD